MPQLMPIFWELSVFMVILLFMVLMEVYYYLNYFNFNQIQLDDLVNKSVEFLW